jgi:hypothetical protein
LLLAGVLCLRRRGGGVRRPRWSSCSRSRLVTVYTTSSWKSSSGSEDTFVEAWKTFAGWASGQPGAGSLRLARDLHEPGRFVSFGAWDSLDAEGF